MNTRNVKIHYNKPEQSKNAQVKVYERGVLILEVEGKTEIRIKNDNENCRGVILTRKHLSNMSMIKYGGLRAEIHSDHGTENEACILLYRAKTLAHKIEARCGGDKNTTVVFKEVSVEDK